MTSLNTLSEEYFPLEQYTEKAYLEYSMYVILDRALPSIADGLKPVQRRIVYAMSELGLKATAKYKKSARTVGDVLGKFHPHGDTACYEAMVLMAQPFSYRYPLVDGQGNWGAPDDPKSFAAMRYTESRLAAYAEILLSEVGQGTVEWNPNFDGTLKEPAILPARLPNILLNGTTGIAVGMATDVPPHNLKEVTEACVHLLEKPDATLEEICEILPGPDFPTKAEIVTPKADLLNLYRTGNGSLKMRATYYRENGDVVISALPYQASGTKIQEQIAALMQAKKLPMVADLRDESDHEDPTRLVIVPRSNRVDVEELMAHLFATTDLEKSYRVNLNVIGLDHRPQVKDLITLIKEWLIFRIETVRKRLQYRLDKVRERLHILEGLMIAYLNIDEVIAIIRNEDEPKPVLMERFQLSDRQAEAILEIKLRQLAKLEEIKIRGELDELSAERDQLEKILNSERRLKTQVRKEIEADAKTYGDKRMSPIVERQAAQAISQADLIPVEPVTVVLSRQGWVRTAKGHDLDAEKLIYKSGDMLRAVAIGRSNDQAVFLDSTGRSYALPAHSFPSARSHGEPLSGRVNLPPQAKVVTVLLGKLDMLLLISSTAGYGFIATLEDMLTKNRNGKAFLSLPQGTAPLGPVIIKQMDEKSQIVAVTNEGRMLLFPLNDLPTLARGKGNKIIHIPPARIRSGEEFLSMITVLPFGWHLTIHAGKRQLVLKTGNLEEYQGMRGRRGRKLPRGYQKVDRMEVTEPLQLPLI